MAPHVAGHRRRTSVSSTPAITHLEGKVLDLVRDALTGEPARARGLFRPEYVDHLLADPNGELTPLRGNKLWQLGLLELWLQSHVE